MWYCGAEKVVVASIVQAPKSIYRQLSDNYLNPEDVMCKAINPCRNVEKLKESIC